MFRRSLLILLIAAAFVAPDAARGQLPPRDSLLSREPETPAEMFQATLTMLKLARPALARQYLDAFMASSPDDATLLQLRETHGTTTFVQLSRIEALQPTGGELLDRLNRAAQNQIDDPAFQASLMAGLTGTARQRDSAITQLRALDEQAAPLVIRRLAQGASVSDEALLMQALLQLGPNATDPLIATLSSPHERLRIVAADLLGRMEAKRAVLPLTSIAFDSGVTATLQQAARQAVARIEFGSADRVQQVTGLRLAERLQFDALAHFSGAAEWETDDSGRVSLWTWDEAAGTAVQQQVSPTSASAWQAEQSARRALALSPADRRGQALLLAILMWRDVLTAGWEKPLPAGPGTAGDLALSLGPDVSREALQLSLEHSNAAAALVSLRALGSTGGRSELLAPESPVLAALQSGEPRVQFAAAETVLQLDPVQPFPGATRVVEILVRTLNGTPVRKSVVVDPNADRGAAIAGLIASMGYQPGLAPTGKSGFEMAATEGNVELAVLHLNTVQWELSQTVANLRADPRTARIPIAVYGPPQMRNAARRQVGTYQLISYLDDSGDPQILRAQLEPLIGRRSVPELTEAQRLEQIHSAAFWLRHIASGRRTQVFPLDSAELALAEAITRPGVSRDVLVALGAIGTPSAQQRLADASLSVGLSPETQLVAAAQLGFHIQRFGRLVNNQTAQQLSSAWRNAASPELKTALAAVVGAMRPESPAVTAELQIFPTAIRPLP